MRQHLHFTSLRTYFSIDYAGTNNYNAPASHPSRTADDDEIWRFPQRCSNRIKLGFNKKNKYPFMAFTKITNNISKAGEIFLNFPSMLVWSSVVGGSWSAFKA
jgi:hypothetical protein